MEEYIANNMKYWKVYAQCVNRPRGQAVIEIKQWQAEELIADEVYRASGDGNLKELEAYFAKLGEDEDADADMISAIEADYLDKAYEVFEKYGSFNCADFMVCKSVQMPDRPNICGCDACNLD